MTNLLMSILSFLLLMITNINVEQIPKIETQESYQECTKEITINNTMESVSVLWDMEKLRYIYQLKENNAHNEIYVKRAKLYETVLREVAQEEEEVVFLLQILIWNLEEANFLQTIKEERNLKYRVENEAVNEIYQQIIEELVIDENDREIELDDANTQQNYVSASNKQRIGPYILKDKRILSELNYYVYFNDEREQIIASDVVYGSNKEFYVEHEQFQEYDLNFQISEKQYDLFYISRKENKKQKYFYFDEIEEKILFQKKLSFPSFVGEFQIQFVTAEHKLLQNTIFELINIGNDEKIVSNVNGAGTRKITGLIPGEYQLKYYPNDTFYIKQGIVESIIIVPNESIKLVEEVQPIVGEIILNLQATNKKAVELYELKNEKKIFKQRFELMNQKQYIISNLSAGEYVLNFLLDNYEETSEEIIFTINNDIQLLEYNILQTEHKLLVATGELRVYQLIGCVIFIISFCFLFFAKGIKIFTFRKRKMKQ